jgi:hypothetical protein
MAPPHFILNQVQDRLFPTLGSGNIMTTLSPPPADVRVSLKIRYNGNFGVVIIYSFPAVLKNSEILTPPIRYQGDRGTQNGCSILRILKLSPRERIITTRGNTGVVIRRPL